MELSKIVYSNHAVQKMFERNINADEIEYALKNGINIKKYPNDTPYPSKLLLAFINGRPLHIVYSIDQENSATVIITCYEPSQKIWESDYKTRKT